MNIAERYRPNKETDLTFVLQRRQCLTCGACIFEFDGQLLLHHQWHEDLEALRAAIQELNPGVHLNGV